MEEHYLPTRTVRVVPVMEGRAGQPGDAGMMHLGVMAQSTVLASFLSMSEPAPVSTGHSHHESTGRR